MPRHPKPPESAAPRERSSTVRAELRRALEMGPVTAHELSARAGIRERDVAEHLEHLARSLEPQGERLVIDPAHCLACGFVFRERRRYTTPSRCPKCGSERIEPPTFHVQAR